MTKAKLYALLMLLSIVMSVYFGMSAGEANGEAHKLFICATIYAGVFAVICFIWSLSSSLDGE